MITTLVQTCPARTSTLLETLRSIRESDLDDPIVAMNPPGVSRIDHMIRSLEILSQATTTPLALRLEDDVLVNRHFAYNVSRWHALEDPLFGCGWLWCAKYWAESPVWTRTSYGEIYRTPNELERIPGTVTGALAVLFRTADLPQIVTKLRDERELRLSVLGGDCGQDRRISHAVLSLGREIYRHDPVLVEHADVPSTMPYRSTPPARYRFARNFDPEFRV